MQLVSLGVFSKDGRRRDVEFRLGALNVLTGKSKTGKSAILDIAEYCLGRSTVTIPTGVISDNVSWYYLLVQIGNERVLICRPNPSSARTNRAMIRTGDVRLGPPSFGELEVDADTDVVRDILSDRLSIERYTVEPESGSLRYSFEVSVRQALFFCLQNQNEISNQDILFHRQVDSDIRTTIRDTLPYFLGVSTPEQSAVRRQLLATRRTLQRTQNSIRVAEADLDQQDSRVTHLIESALALGVLRSEVGLDTGNGVRSLLEGILSYAADERFDDEEATGRQRELTQVARELRARIREIDDQLDLLESLQREQSRSDEETRYQTERLRALDVLLPRSAAAEGDAAVCPLCEQNLPHPDETVEELRQLLENLEGRLSSSQGVSVRRESSIERLRTSREPLIRELRENAVEMDAMAQQDLAIAAGRERRERIAFLQGRVSQELERGVDLTGDLTELRNAEHRYRGQLARLEELYERNDPAVALRAAMDAISEIVTDYARSLHLEGSEHSVRLDPVDLTVSVQRPGGRVPLSRMGSAENWVGYHLVAHLALHHWFVNRERPVPRFLMFDQPTQAFFPEEVVDAADDENADWEAVRRQFALMRDVVLDLGGALQIIVCDHANLADEWFQDSVIDNWRNGIALIPEEWLADDGDE